MATRKKEKAKTNGILLDTLGAHLHRGILLLDEANQRFESPRSSNAIGKTAVWRLTQANKRNKNITAAALIRRALAAARSSRWEDAQGHAQEAERAMMDNNAEEDE